MTLRPFLWPSAQLRPASLQETRNPYALIPADRDALTTLAGHLRGLATDGLEPLHHNLTAGRTRLTAWTGPAATSAGQRIRTCLTTSTAMTTLTRYSADLIDAYIAHLDLARGQAFEAGNDYTYGLQLSDAGQYAAGVACCRRGVARLELARHTLQQAATDLAKVLDRITGVLPTAPSLLEHPTWHLELVGKAVQDAWAFLGQAAEADTALNLAYNPLVPDAVRTRARQHLSSVAAGLKALTANPEKTAHALLGTTMADLSPVAFAAGMIDPLPHGTKVGRILQGDYGPGAARVDAPVNAPLRFGRSFSYGSKPTTTAIGDLDANDLQLPTGIHEPFSTDGAGNYARNTWDDSVDHVGPIDHANGVQDHHALDHRMNHDGPDEYRHQTSYSAGLHDYRHDLDLASTQLGQQHLVHDLKTEAKLQQQSRATTEVLDQAEWDAPPTQPDHAVEPPRSSSSGTSWSGAPATVTSVKDHVATTTAFADDEGVLGWGHQSESVFAPQPNELQAAARQVMARQDVAHLLDHGTLSTRASSVRTLLLNDPAYRASFTTALNNQVDRMQAELQTSGGGLAGGVLRAKLGNAAPLQGMIKQAQSSTLGPDWNFTLPPARILSSHDAVMTQQLRTQLVDIRNRFEVLSEQREGLSPRAIKLRRGVTEQMRAVAREWDDLQASLDRLERPPKN